MLTDQENNSLLEDDGDLDLAQDRYSPLMEADAEALRQETDLLQLFKQPGWTLIKNFIENETNLATERLIEESVEVEKTKLQMYIKALRLIPELILNVMVQADGARVVLKESEITQDQSPLV